MVQGEEGEEDGWKRRWFVVRGGGVVRGFFREDNRYTGQWEE